MSKKEGIVVSVSGKYANLLTPHGEFIKVSCRGKKPSIGEIFQGYEVSNNIFHFNTKGLAAAACIMFILTIGGGAKAYYSPVATVLVSINPHIELKVNFLNKIISSKALNDDGSKILSEVKIKNVNINEGLEIIIDQSKKDKFIDDNYIKTKTISVDIDGKSIDISKFKSNIQSSNLSIKIQSNGDVILNKNINSKSNGSANYQKPSENNAVNGGRSSINNGNGKSSSNNGNQNNSNNENNNGNVTNSKSDKGKEMVSPDLKQTQGLENSQTKENQGSEKKNDNNKAVNNSSKANSSEQNFNSNENK
jgi:hypothetical protein